MDNFLLESVLLSEFTFGFELEACVDPNTIRIKVPNRKWENDLDEFELNDNRLYVYFDKPDLFKKLKKEFSKTFGNDINIIHDDSLNANGFEFPSPTMNITPLNIKKTINFLSSLKKSKFKIHTDDKCGFHIHLSLPTLTLEDCIWLVCHLSLNEEMINELTSLKIENGKIIDFYNPKYTDIKYLKELKKSIEDSDYQKIIDILNDGNEKHRILRIHPQGTLEWRGPRNFLNSENIQDIKLFFNKIIKITKWISLTLENKDILGINKSTFFNILKSYNEDIIMYDFKKNNKSIEKFINNPKLLSKISSISFKKASSLIDDLYHYDNYKKFNNLLTDIKYIKLNPNILASILIYEPIFYKYCVQNLPINELFSSGYKGPISTIISELKFNDKEIIQLFDDFKYKMSDFLQILFQSLSRTNGNYNPFTSKVLNHLAKSENQSLDSFLKVWSHYIPVKKIKITTTLI